MNKFKYYFENSLHYYHNNEIYLIDDKQLKIKYKIYNIFYNKKLKLNVQNLYNDNKIPIIINHTKKTIKIKYNIYFNLQLILYYEKDKIKVFDDIKNSYSKFLNYKISIDYTKYYNYTIPF